MIKEPALELARDRLKGRGVIAIVSGKGGVGKSTVSALTALSIANRDYAVLIDLDIHGMSVPRLFGIENKMHDVSREGLEPIMINERLGIISLRGVIGSKYVVLPGERRGGVLLDLLAYTNYRDSKYVIIDMPPGMSDELLILHRVRNYLPIVVTSPSRQSVGVVEDLVRYLTDSGIKPTAMIINMAFMKCGHEVVKPFGSTDWAIELARKYGIELIKELPIDPAIEEYIGKINEYSGQLLTELSSMINTVIQEIQRY
ncbi:P-loop NTPase [Vulcanisaeta distributa]|uniref:ATPase-like, ParA/MinD n=1 Tax=Vulcanisaeta distributa (strain DSM 14429 / JCM 11212 / NBRC 100878 / IC-017) TaxID=572478 RepID=E1QQT3_VULDI|nr:P-loop NTPase [Vulcanisaeta distributa]ADN51695.1 ATPase-like, ParA/MinD [Vulcanisaeta distributa DSM 14429]